LKRAQLFSPDYGIWGSIGNGKGYRGDWTVKIDIVNWYIGPQQFSPAPASLLQGESTFLFPYNHFGPYGSRSNITIPNTAVGGHLSIVVSLDLRAYVRGHIYSYNWFDEARTTSWALIEMRKGKDIYRAYSMDGFYDTYLPNGFYNFRVSHMTLTRGEVATNRTIVLSDGARILKEDFFLEPPDALRDKNATETSQYGTIPHQTYPYGKRVIGQERKSCVAKLICSDLCHPTATKTERKNPQLLNEAVVYLDRDGHLQLSRHNRWRRCPKLVDLGLRDVGRSYRN